MTGITFSWTSPSEVRPLSPNGFTPKGRFRTFLALRIHLADRYYLAMITLTSDRLNIRPWKENDAAFIYDMYSRWEVQRFLGHSPSIMETLDEAERLTNRLRQAGDPLLGYWAVELGDGTVVGTTILQRIRLSGTAEPSKEIEIGWHFHPDHWGNGYASEAASRVLRHAFDANTERIIAVVLKSNESSERVCHRIGMKNLGTTRRYYDAEYTLFEATKAS